ncbi:dehydratase [Herbihabitans rhizosphaerae]|uniref:Dehydratase n=1 Tax=Herbihabitans rhizosphaerae TaxID=1872711 RepID=A0A4Q7KE00_9PSEU|nr:cyclase [Herbihabitans rhizosphaerae]RZS31447.1 dehydratase [Herbihabitans rhizosphaerae]
MKVALRRSSLRALAVAAIAAATVVGLAPTASAAAHDITFDCRAKTPIGDQQATLTQTVDATAPATVAPGGALDIVVDPTPNDIPGEINGNKIKEVKNFTLKVPIPANSTYVSADLTGGSGLGPTPPEIKVENGIAVVTFPGPIAGGAQFELPTITAHLTAGQSGAIESKLYGASYDDPGLTFTAVISSIIGDVEAPTSCFPNPNPVLTTTTIG